LGDAPLFVASTAIKHHYVIEGIIHLIHHRTIYVLIHLCYSVLTEQHTGSRDWQFSFNLYLGKLGGKILLNKRNLESQTCSLLLGFSVFSVLKNTTFDSLFSLFILTPNPP
jgi:hypothetical protein